MFERDIASACEREQERGSDRERNATGCLTSSGHELGHCLGPE